MEESVRRNEERFHLLIGSVREYSMVTLDLLGHVSSWNPAVERMYGYRGDEIFGQHVSKFYCVEDIQLAKPQMVLDRAASDGRFEEEGWRVRKDGTPFFATVTVTPLRGEDGQLLGFAEVTCDMTRVHEANTRSSHTERLATVGSMIAGLAHESRNALQQIQASVEMLTRRMQDDITSSLLGEIQKAHDRLLRLFEDVRAYAAPLTLNTRVQNVANLWREAWRHLEPLRKDRQIQLNEQIGSTDLNCLVDQFSMERAFHNILLNSLYACSDPAIIEIRCSETDFRDLPALRLAISDNGPGLNAEQKRRIFQPFYTTKTKGTGLGMAITKRVIEAHGGHIHVGPDRNGTEIIITLPKGEL
jgi:PAS domain S-box-containing protein